MSQVRRMSNAKDGDWTSKINELGHYTCLNCEKDLSFDKRRTSFCSPICKSEYISKFVWWYNLRLECFERDKWHCRKCSEEVFDAQYHPDPKPPEGWLINPNKAAECDHTMPIFLGGADLDVANLQTLCSSCHKKKSIEEAKQRRKIVKLIRIGVQKTLMFTQIASKWKQKQ